MQEQRIDDRQDRHDLGLPGRSGLLTAEAVSRLLHVDASTIYRMAGDGRLPAVKVGRQWRFPAQRIAALLDVDPATLSDLQPAVEPTAAVPSLDGAHAQPVIDVAADLLGVMMVVTDMEGRPLTRVANPCPSFAQRGADPDLVAQCLAEWRSFADDPDFEPRFRAGAFGFECARALVRDGRHLVGMVLAGGVAPAGEPADGRYLLDADQRHQVLATLPKVAATLSRTAHATAQPSTTSTTQGVLR